MPCVNYEGAIVCTSPSDEFRMIRRCPSCRTKRRMVRRFEGWYGDMVWCCGCGNTWSDGWLTRRLRTPKAKAGAIAKAKAKWVAARPAAEYRPHLDAWLEDYRS